MFRAIVPISDRTLAHGLTPGQFDQDHGSDGKAFQMDGFFLVPQTGTCSHMSQQVTMSLSYCSTVLASPCGFFILHIFTNVLQIPCMSVHMYMCVPLCVHVCMHT